MATRSRNKKGNATAVKVASSKPTKTESAEFSGLPDFTEEPKKKRSKGLSFSSMKESAQEGKRALIEKLRG